jgi:predicted hotdog family 3-hydroxylacyl-ACP dehydratase
MLCFPVPAQTVLPHTLPMLCIDTLIAVSETSAEAIVNLAPGHILLEGDTLSEVGYIELAAQTAGAMKGYWKIKAGRPIGDGYLVAVQNFTVSEKARIEERLTIQIELLTVLSNIYLIEAKIVRLPKEVNNKTYCCNLASGKLKLFIPEDEAGHED